MAANEERKEDGGEEGKRFSERKKNASKGGLEMKIGLEEGRTTLLTSRQIRWDSTGVDVGVERTGKNKKKRR